MRSRIKAPTRAHPESREERDRVIELAQQQEQERSNAAKGSRGHKSHGVEWS